MRDLRHIDDMRCPSRRSERYIHFYCLFLSDLDIPSQVIQQTLGQQVSQPVAQIVAGFAKVFVGEMVEKGNNLPYETYVPARLNSLFHSTRRSVAAGRDRTVVTGPPARSLSIVSGGDRSCGCSETAQIKKVVRAVDFVLESNVQQAF